MYNTDEFYIRKALKLAKKGYGFVSPNPMVGALIVKDGKIIGSGYHKMYGEAHAEVEAIRSVVDKNDLVDATIYVTLQPCSHFGKTPPCAELIVNSGIKKVVYASSDTNHLVNDSILKSAGIEVVSGILKTEADFLNRKFLYWKQSKRPYITLKVGSTLDGKMADKHYNSKWITSAKARDYVYKVRAGYDAILIGGGTLRSDNPNLGLHGIKARKEPLRILIGSRELDLSCDFARDDNFVQLHNFDDYWEYCDKHDVSSVFVEGGSQIFKYFIENRYFNELLVFYGSKIIGSEHLNWALNKDISGISDSLELSLHRTMVFDGTLYAQYLL